MIDFKPVELSDKSWIQPFYDKNTVMLGEYSFSNNYGWGLLYNIKAAKKDGYLLLTSYYSRHSYLFPLGEGDLKPVILGILEDADERGIPFRMNGITKENMMLMQAIFPGKFAFSPDRDSFDYIYERDKLASLSGRRLHSKRNNINKFTVFYPDWQYQPITPENLPECHLMHEQWRKENEQYADRSLIDESEHVNRLMNAFFDLDMAGGLLRAGGNVIAFTAGSRLTADCFIVHVEKALASYQGSYQVINREFAENACAGYRWINREDDIGDEGLRRAKLSYYPEILMEKYVAVLNKD